jgi:signal transduction histidine kinase
MKESISGFALCDTDGTMVGVSGEDLNCDPTMRIADLAACLNYPALPEQYQSFVESGLETRVLGSDDTAIPYVLFRRLEHREGALVMVEWGPDAARQRWTSLAEIGSLAAMFVHELRNQLGGLKLYATFLRKKLSELPVERQNGIEIADKIIQSINVMTDYSGLFGRLARPFKVNPETGDLRSLIESVVGDTSAQARERGVAINIREMVNSNVALDRVQVSRALNAVLCRAIRTSGEGGTVEIVYGQEADRAVLSIQDSGPVPGEARRDRPATLALLLSNGRLTEGTFDLAVAERVLSAHGGSVEVSSAGHSGTRVTFRFPVAAQQPA